MKQRSEDVQELECQKRLTPFTKFLGNLDRSSVTGWRWRKLGWIQVVRIGGRLYVSEREIRKFQERAEAGEFVVRGDQ